MNPAEEQILTRIGFAERWLQRAREECRDGDVTRGLLTLVLADAEVRRLLQLAASPPPRRRLPFRPSVALAGLAVALLAAIQVGVVDLSAATIIPAGQALAPSLTLRAGDGLLLPSLITDPAGQSIGPDEPRRVMPAVRTAVPMRPAPPVVTHRSAPRGPVPAPAVPQARPAPAPAAAQPAAPHPAASPAAAAASSSTADATLSTADLLDLVIVADRTLRRSQP